MKYKHAPNLYDAHSFFAIDKFVLTTIFVT